MPTLKRIKFVRGMTLKEVYARSTIDELKRNIKLNKAMLNEGTVNPESWRKKWLEEIKGFKWAICGFRKLLTQKRKSAGMQCPFCGTEMFVRTQGRSEALGIKEGPKCNATVHRYKMDDGIMESQSKYIKIA